MKLDTSSSRRIFFFLFCLFCSRWDAPQALARGGVKAPSGLSAFAIAYNSVSLSWSDSSHHESGFLVQRVDASTNTKFVDLVTLPSNTSKYTDKTVQPQMTYSYRVVALSAGGDRYPSEVIQVKTPSDPGTGGGGTGGADSQAPTASLTAPMANSLVKGTLSISATASDNVGVSQVEFYYDAEVLISSSTASPYTATLNTLGDTVAKGVADGNHKLYVKAADAAGNVVTSAAVAITVDNTAPSVPSGLMLMPISTSQINVSWTASSDGSGSGVASYKVYKDGTLLTTVTSPTVSYSNTGLVASTQYCYTLQAVDRAGNASVQSTQQCGKTLDAVLKAPSNLVAKAISGNQVTLTWTDNSTSESGFKIERVVSGADPNYVEIARTAANVTTFTDTSVTFSTLYNYRIRAFDSTGDSPYSFPTSTKTPALAGSDTAPPGFW